MSQSCAKVVLHSKNCAVARTRESCAPQHHNFLGGLTYGKCLYNTWWVHKNTAVFYHIMPSNFDCVVNSYFCRAMATVQPADEYGNKPNEMVGVHNMPLIETPWSWVSDHWMTWQGGPCGEDEYYFMKCVGHVGVKRAPVECKKLHDDFMECAFRMKTVCTLPPIWNIVISFTQPPSGKKRMRICFADVFFCFLFFSVHQNYETTVLGNSWTDFHETLPNNTGENVVWNVVPPLGESCAATWRMANVDDCVIYDMTLSESPEGATHGGCVIQPWAGEWM